jgi:hypothetical protein
LNVQAVVNYFAREPELEDGEQHAIALSKLVVTALRENAGWIDDHVCSVCACPGWIIIF